MRILIDTNVILDAILPRGEFSRLAWLLVRKHEEKSFQGFVSASAITDVYFLVEKVKKRDLALLAIKKVVRMLTVIPVNFEIIEAAIDSGMKGFEDAVQAAAARDFGVNTVVTRDKTGFRDSDLRVCSPEEFLETVK
ncbi:MAG: PIN domain-containing protein [Planctomycetaceae bacterium]|nr:PIN domain-containing protein [Planctomycetaceae bacterium]